MPFFSDFTITILSFRRQLSKTDHAVTFETVNGQLGSALYSEKYLKTEIYTLGALHNSKLPKVFNIL